MSARSRSMTTNEADVKVVRENMQEITGDGKDFTTLMQAIGDAEVVMIGEATHGTEEFYAYRAELTKKLIKEKGFNFVAVEGDWPDTYRVNRYVKCADICNEKTAEESLGDFNRFPRWMWRNTVVEDFLEWLRSYNMKHKKMHKRGESESDAGAGNKTAVGFYGLDLYSLFTSVDRVIEYLNKIDPEDAKKAKRRYSVLEQYRGRESDYGFNVALNMSPSREKEVVSMLVEMLKNGPEYINNSGGFDGDEYFWATQNARVVCDAEKYYRNSYSLNGYQTWNLRDSHMLETLVNVMEFHRDSLGIPKVKAVVWAHNSHLGDARATEYSRRGELNVGQLVREKFGLNRTFNVGFTTYDGTVTAARKWGGEAECFDINPAESDTYEHLFHAAKKGNFLILLRSLDPKTKISDRLKNALDKERYERMIGVQYCKRTERQSHYILTKLSRQFDAIVHLDRTSALPPLDK